MKTDEEILREYYQEIGQPYPEKLAYLLLPFVRKAREEEPKIDSGIHLVDYINICDEGDTMESFYGEDYFK